MIGSSLDHKMEVFVEGLFENLEGRPISAISPEEYTQHVNLQKIEKSMAAAGFKTLNLHTFISTIANAVFRRVVSLN